MFRGTGLSGLRALASLGGAALISSACGGAGASPTVARSARLASVKPSLLMAPPPAAPAGELGPRLFPPIDGPEVLLAGEERDGSRRLVAYGLRVLSRPDGAVELSREYLPAARTVQSIELPSRLGGGFLFFVLSSSATLFFRAQSFTADLEPFARLDFEAEQVIAGFDRLYVLGARSERLVALDAEHGVAVGLGSLPTSPGFGKMVFIDAWFGAVQVPFRGTLLTFDAGVSWRPLSFSTSFVGAHDTELVLVGPEGVLGLDRNGTFSRRDASWGRANGGESELSEHLLKPTPARDEARISREPLGRRALKLAVLHGFRDADGSFVVASAGALLRVRPSDGKVVESDAHAYPGGSECSALSFGRSSAFACGDGTDQTALFAFVPPFGMRHVHTFSGARYVAASGSGALVVRGACEAGSEKAAGAYCIVGRDGSFREIHVRGDLGVERVVALSDGRAAVIVPPRLGAGGFLSLIDPENREQRVPLKIPSSDEHGDSLLEKGLWLDGFLEQSDGTLAGWVAGAGPFVGVRVSLDGNVTVSHREGAIDRALLSGSHALIVGRTGRALESTNSGFEWSEVDLPSEFDATREPRDEARLQGCSDLGCAFGGFVRVGWRTGGAAPRLRVAHLPDPTPLLQPGGGRWSLHCEATGEVSEPAVAVAARLRGPGSDDNLTAPWGSFLELPPPALAAGEVGYDAPASDTDLVALHAYAWGERGADWARAGHVQLRALDRFQLARGTFQSAVTRSPWPDATSAAEAFGFDGTNNPTTWRALLETGQRSGAVVVSSRGLLDLLLFEEGRAVTRIPNSARLGFGTLMSVTKLGDAWYASASSDNRALTLSRIIGSRVERLAEYPDALREPTHLVRGVHGDALGIWVLARGWYLFPIDPATGAAHSPLYESPADLAVMPPLCLPDADGFLLSGSPTLEPTISFQRTTLELAARRVEAQFIWSARGLCTRALAADTEAVPRRMLAPSARSISKASTLVPLSLAERRPEGRRWGFLCAP